MSFDPVPLLCTDEEDGFYPGIRNLPEQGPTTPNLLSLKSGAALGI
jgi:hypothetical protein